jgi:hypothetical protein
MLVQCTLSCCSGIQKQQQQQQATKKEFPVLYRPAEVCPASVASAKAKATLDNAFHSQSREDAFMLEQVSRPLSAA